MYMIGISWEDKKSTNTNTIECQMNCNEDPIQDFNVFEFSNEYVNEGNKVHSNKKTTYIIN